MAPPYPESASTVQPRASTGTNSLPTVTGSKRRWTCKHVHKHNTYTYDMRTSHKMNSESSRRHYTISGTRKLFYLPSAHTLAHRLTLLALHFHSSLSYTHLLSSSWLTFFTARLIGLVILLTHLCLLSLRSQLKELAVAIWATDVRAPGTKLHLDERSPLKCVGVAPKYDRNSVLVWACVSCVLSADVTETVGFQLK